MLNCIIVDTMISVSNCVFHNCPARLTDSCLIAIYCSLKKIIHSKEDKSNLISGCKDIHQKVKWISLTFLKSYNIIRLVFLTELDSKLGSRRCSSIERLRFPAGTRTCTCSSRFYCLRLFFIFFS